jgi:hypothetical protein
MTITGTGCMTVNKAKRLAGVISEALSDEIKKDNRTTQQDQLNAFK